MVTADDIGTKYMQVRIHILAPKLLGDKNQATGIKNALQKKLANEPVSKIETKEWDESKDIEYKELQRELASDAHKHVLIAVGDHGIQALQKIKKTRGPKFLTVYASHQLSLDLKKIISSIDILALPIHIKDSQFQKDLPKRNFKFVKTLGVAHCVYLEDLPQALLDWQKNSPQPIKLNKRYIGVLLGGDAPDADGAMRYLTKDDAKKLARFLVNLYIEKDKPTLLITNSPRTGKFNPETNEELKVHTGVSIDETSQALLSELDKHNVKYQFFDFVTGKTSAYKAILGALHHSKDSITVITGDSTSMVTEIVDSLADTPCYVVNVNSMSAAHQAHVRFVNKYGYAHMVDLRKDDFTIFPPQQGLTDKHYTAAEVISHTIIESLGFYHKIEHNRTMGDLFNASRLSGELKLNDTSKFFYSIPADLKETFESSTKQIIQFGISTGDYLKELCKKTERSIIGYDISPVAIKHFARTKITGREVDLNETKVDDKSCLAYQDLLAEDLAVSTQILIIRTLEYLNPEAMKLFIFSLINLAKPGSQFYLEIFSGGGGDLIDNAGFTYCYQPEAGYCASFFGPRTDIRFDYHKKLISKEGELVERLIVSKF